MKEQGITGIKFRLDELRQIAKDNPGILADDSILTENIDQGNRFVICLKKNDRLYPVFLLNLKRKDSRII